MPVSITSRFKPMTYDEISRPLIEQTQAQQALEGAYMEASTQAAQIMAQADEQTDPIAYARLKSYSDALQQQADSLMQQGLNRNSRRALLEMRKRYNQYIMPVQNAAERRKELSEERRKLSLSHPDMIWERDTLNLDDLMQNPQLDYGRTVLGSQLTERVGQAVAAAARGIQSIALGQNLDKYTQTVIQQAGFTPEQIAAAISNGLPSDHILTQIRDGILRSIGVMDWKNEAAKQKALEYANEGYYRGIGNRDIKTQQDVAAVKNLEYQHSLGLMREKARLDREAEENKATRDKASKNAFSRNPISINNWNQTQSKYNDLLDKMTTATGYGKSSYFGSEGKANPLDVYEKRQAFYKQFEKDWAEKGKAEMTIAEIDDYNNPDKPNTTRVQQKYSDKNLKIAFEDTWNAIKGDYGFQGVTDVLSDEEYKLLKSLDYDSSTEGMGQAGALAERVYGQSQMYTLDGVNIPDFEKTDASQSIKENLNHWVDKGKNTLKQHAQLLDIDTGKTENISKSDIRGKVVRNVFYSALYRDKVILKLSPKDDIDGTPIYVLADPAVIPDGAAVGLINKMQGLMYAQSEGKEARDPQVITDLEGIQIETARSLQDILKNISK